MRYYGAAYYPEQETPEEVERDAATMRELGFNAVRVGEFAWSSFEPRDGQFDFAWLDDALARLDRHGVAAVICTPTACPPIWLVEKHPEILYRDNRGVTRPFGGRRHYCPTNAAYREHCRHVTEAIARHYADDRRVLGFHIDNELGQEGTGRCQCQACQRGFVGWLERRYGTIAEFNRAAGTVFWSQTYERFDQIRPPLRSIEPGAGQPIENFVDNPTLRIDWERFSSDAINGFQRVQLEELRRHSRKRVTTNAVGMWTNANDLYASFAELDVAGGDVYPGLRTNDLSGVVNEFAFYRGLKRRDFWVLETSSGGGHGVWAGCGILQPFPGALRQTALLAFACGAELVTYFQYKTFRFGAEQLEAAVIDIDGVPRRRFREFQRTAADIAKLAPALESTSVVNQVAMVYDYDVHRAIRIKPFSREFSYQGQIQQVARLLGSRGIGCDVIPATAALDQYRCVILPTPVILDEAAKARLKEFVRGGGTVLTNFLAAIKGPLNTAERVSTPAGLTDLFGMRVGEGEPVYRDAGPGLASSIELAVDGLALTSNAWTWTESLEPQGAEIIGRYRDTYRKGEAVVTRHRFGKGTAWYLGTWLDEEPLTKLLEHIAVRAGASAAPFTLAAGTEAVHRRGDAGDLWFLFNYREQPSSVGCTGAFEDLLTGRGVSGTIELAPKEVLALRARR
jgi:beta-galactosidase